MSDTADHAAGRLAEFRDERYQQLREWMWRQHTITHVHCHERWRQPFHPNPVLCQCFQDAPPVVRQLLAAEWAIRAERNDLLGAALDAWEAEDGHPL